MTVKKKKSCAEIKGECEKHLPFYICGDKAARTQIALVCMERRVYGDEE